MTFKLKFFVKTFSSLEKMSRKKLTFSQIFAIFRLIRRITDPTPNEFFRIRHFSAYAENINHYIYLRYTFEYIILI
jgi:hypothetical protein